MYSFLSIVLFLVGAALVALVFVRKVPALAELPEMNGPRKPSLVRRVISLFARIDWQKWQRRLFRLLAMFARASRRFFVRFTKRSEKWIHALEKRVRHLSDIPHFERKNFPLASRIKKRAAFVEEERKLIEQLTADPKDIDAYRRLGNLYVVAGNTADARAAFSEILRLNPEDDEAVKRLSELSDK